MKGLRHRIGRTARASRKGEAFTLIVPDDMQRFGRIEKLIEKTVDKLDLPETVGDGPKYDPSNVKRRGGFKNRRSNKQSCGKKKPRGKYGKKR